MNPSDLGKIEHIVSEALSYEGVERRQFVEKQCRDAPELRVEIEAMLSLARDADSFFDSPAAVHFGSLIGAEANLADIGKQIGNYRLESEIGTGGMGAVYLAARTDGEFKQKVAIKMLRREFNTAQIRQRFEHEKEIQAALDHPNIARLLDAGTTDDGIPYLVMEYIDGDNIGAYCRRRSLDLEQRLELFTKVCGAVAFAHRNLVIHRDLKPSNILVSSEGEPKLLDFGISKLLSTDSDDIHTVTKLGVMTPEYASPEQVEGKSVATATDIYSLGVILFELLTGKKPFTKVVQDSGNIFKAILEIEPEKPSSVLHDHQERVPAVDAYEWRNSDGNIRDDAATQVVTPQKTKELVAIEESPSGIRNPKLLRGDLDNIILKALRKEPERRYQTVDQLSDDIRRHLEGLPISARPATVAYRTSKFVRRNLAAVIGGGLILVAIIAGSAATYWQAKVAEARFDEVRSIANSFLFEITPEIEKLPGSTKAKELVVKRALGYLDKLSQSAGNDPGLLRELAAAYEKVGSVQGNPAQNNLGDAAGAQQSYEKAKAIRERLLSDNPNDLQLQGDLARVMHLLGDLKFYADNLDESEADYLKAFELRTKIAEAIPNDTDAQKNLATLQNDLGKVMFWKGDRKTAWEYHEKARVILEMLSEKNPADHKIAEDTAITYILLGYLLGWEERFAEAGEYLERGLSMLRTIVNEHPEDLGVRRTLMIAYLRRAENFTDLKQYDKSVELYSEGEKIAETAAREDPENSRARRDLLIMKFKVAEVLSLAGKTAGGLVKLNEVLAIQKQRAAAEPEISEHVYDIAKTQNTVGEAYLKLRDYEKALRVFQEALGNFEQVVSRDASNTVAIKSLALTKQNLGKTFQALADHRSALANYKESLDILNKLKSENALAELDQKLLTELESQISEVNREMVER